MTLRLLSTLLLALALLHPATAAPTADPFAWLEDVDSEKSLAWVRERSLASAAEIEAQPEFLPTFNRLVGIYDSDARIPVPLKRGRWLYNFWRDAAHPQGIWRRTTEAEYARARPAWETVIDVDALSAAENIKWVWKGAACLYPDYQRCLISLSRGGADATVVREFDTESRRFVDDGYGLPEAKQTLTWLNRDRVLVASDFGPGSLTRSGYPRLIREWQRGTPISEARTVFEGQVDDVAVSVAVTHEPAQRRELVIRHLSFFESEYHLRSGDGLTPLRLPLDVDAGLFRDQLIVHLRKDWTVTGRSYSAGSLLALPLAQYIEGRRDFVSLFVPSNGISLASWKHTRSAVLLNLLDRVRGRVETLELESGRWTRRPVDVPSVGEAEAFALDPEGSDEYLLMIENFLTPASLLKGHPRRADRTLLKQQPEFFDARGLNITQHQAVSRDGTRVPYFQVSRSDLKLTGTNPTLLYGYGGFEVSLTPGYYPAVGAAWLERGGTYVLANIRGGGEFGPGWHQAALTRHRQNAYDDFAAVAEDLIKRKLTSPRHLGIQGGSNGGLLVGVAMTQRPELFGAVVSQVPLLDMRRYHRLLAGASWMAEYGDPDRAEDWAWISAYSPYQNLRKDAKYPRVLFTTSTRDDRVHPGHARKMTAKMLSQGHDVLYYENLEGGHGGAANNRQKAFMDALAYSFLLKQLRTPDAPSN